MQRSSRHRERFSVRHAGPIDRASTLITFLQECSKRSGGVGRPHLETPAAHLRGIAAKDYASRYTEIRLTPLSQTNNARLVRNLLGSEDLSPRMREVILRKAEGNPFYVEEIIRSLIDDGATVRDEVDLDKLTGALLAVVEEIIQPAHVLLWLSEIPREASPWGGRGREPERKT